MVFLLIFILFMNISAQTVQIHTDYSAYYNSKENVLVDLTINLEIDKRKSSEGFEGVILVAVEDEKTHKNVVASALKVPRLFTYDSVGALTYTTKATFLVPTGKYLYSVIVKNMDNRIVSRIDNHKMQIIPFAEHSPSISSITFCSSIKKLTDSTSAFIRNEHEIIPHASLIFGESQPALFYYFEVYGTNIFIDTTVSMQMQIVNAIGEIVWNKKVLVSNNASNAFEAGSVNVSKLETGAYRFKISIASVNPSHNVSTEKAFFVYAPKVKAKINDVKIETEYLASEFAVMGEEEMEELITAMRHITSPFEYKRFKEANDLESRKKLMFNFWKGRDVYAFTGETDFKKNFFQRYNEVRKSYQTTRTKGYNTDRGRVYLVYGKPDDVIRNSSSMDKMASEIWKYQNLEGGVHFIFVDLFGTMDFKLMSSNKTGELYNTEYEKNYGNELDVERLDAYEQLRQQGEGLEAPDRRQK